MRLNDRLRLVGGSRRLATNIPGLAAGRLIGFTRLDENTVERLVDGFMSTDRLVCTEGANGSFMISSLLSCLNCGMSECLEITGGAGSRPPLGVIIFPGPLNA